MTPTTVTEVIAILFALIIGCFLRDNARIRYAQDCGDLVPEPLMVRVSIWLLCQHPWGMAPFVGMLRRGRDDS
jgi:hypothetical protein